MRQLNHAIKHVLMLSLLLFAIMIAFANRRSHRHHSHIVFGQHILNTLEFIIVDLLHALPPYATSQFNSCCTGFNTQTHGLVKIFFINFISKIAKFHPFLL